MRKKLFFVVLPLVLLLALMSLMVSAAGGPWSDNFDSYATGSQMHGQGGWKGWDNNPAAGALTTSAQARSAPNSVDIVGASDLVHEYTATSGQWVYTAWQYIPGNISGTSYFIMTNIYNDGGPYNWSVEVQFDSTSGMMIDDGSSGSVQPFISDQWVEIKILIDLDADTQNFYYNGALFYSGVWNGYVSGPGTGANAIRVVDLYANNATSVYYDDMSLLPPGNGQPGIEVNKSPHSQYVTLGGDATFTITVTNTGNVELENVTVLDPLVPACDNAIGTLPVSATVSYGCLDINVTSSYTNVVTATGVYTGGPTMVTAGDSADVIVLTPNITVIPTSLSSFQFANEVMTDTFTIGNTGNLALNWTLYEAPGDCNIPADIPWAAAAPTSGSIPASGSTDVEVTFDTAGMSPGLYVGKLCIDSDDPDDPTRQVDLTLFIYDRPVIIISTGTLSGTLPENEVMTQTLTISNTGDADLDWLITEGSPVLEGACGTPGDLPWVTVSPSSGSTPPGSSADITVVFDAAGLAAGDYSGELCITSDAPDSPEVAVSLNLTVVQTEFFIYMPVVRRVDEPTAGQRPGLLSLSMVLFFPAAVFTWRRWLRP